MTLRKITTDRQSLTGSGRICRSGGHYDLYHETDSDIHLATLTEKEHVAEEHNKERE